MVLSCKMIFALCGSAETGAVMGSLLALLPEEFVTADLIKLRAKKGMNVSVSSIKSLLHRWKKNRRIAQIGEGRWRRLE